VKLPVVSGAQAIKAFCRAGWIQDRQEGSHVTLVQPGSPVVLTVPLHKELGRGLLRSLIRKAGMTVDEFVRLLS
jgi:predicted RNA binding protein YcfA (HicA-like mRNA interferase family)